MGGVFISVILLALVGIVIYQRNYVKKYSGQYSSFKSIVDNLERDTKKYKDSLSGSYAFDTKQKYEISFVMGRFL